MEAVTKLKNLSNKVNIPQKSSAKKPGERKKKGQVYEEEIDEDSSTEREVDTSNDDYNLDNKGTDFREDEEFMKNHLNSMLDK